MPSSTAVQQIRRAVDADIPALMRIRVAVTENRLPDPSRITAQMYEGYIDELGRGWVYELDGRVAGFSFAARDGTIWALFVEPGFEGRGIGAQLLACAVDWLFALGHPKVVLGTAPGTRAERFYTHRGWTRTGVREDGEVMFLLLRQTAHARPVRSIGHSAGLTDPETRERGEVEHRRSAHLAARTDEFDL